MNLFGIGPFELALVLILALVFLGPEELPKAARALGKALYQLQHMTEPIRAEVARAMQPLEEAKQSIAQPLTDLQQQIQHPLTPRPPESAVKVTAANSPQTTSGPGVGDNADDRAERP